MSDVVDKLDDFEEGIPISANIFSNNEMEIFAHIYPKYDADLAASGKAGFSISIGGILEENPEVFPFPNGRYN